MLAAPAWPEARRPGPCRRVVSALSIGYRERWLITKRSVGRAKYTPGRAGDRDLPVPGLSQRGPPRPCACRGVRAPARRPASRAAAHSGPPRGAGGERLSSLSSSRAGAAPSPQVAPWVGEVGHGVRGHRVSVFGSRTFTRPPVLRLAKRRERFGCWPACGARSRLKDDSRASAAAERAGGSSARPLFEHALGKAAVGTLSRDLLVPRHTRVLVILLLLELVAREAALPALITRRSPQSTCCLSSVCLRADGCDINARRPHRPAEKKKTKNFFSPRRLTTG